MCLGNFLRQRKWGGLQPNQRGGGGSHRKSQILRSAWAPIVRVGNPDSTLLFSTSIYFLACLHFWSHGKKGFPGRTEGGKVCEVFANGGKFNYTKRTWEFAGWILGIMEHHWVGEGAMKFDFETACMSRSTSRIRNSYLRVKVYLLPVSVKRVYPD